MDNLPAGLSARHRIGRYIMGGSRARRVAVAALGLAVLVGASLGIAAHARPAQPVAATDRSDDRASRDELRVAPTSAVPLPTPPASTPVSATPAPVATTVKPTTTAPKPAATTKKATPKAAPKVTAKAAPLVASAGCGAYTGNRLIACNLLPSFGFGTGEMAALSPMWDKESGWTTSAANPSGAYGIPQALPGSKMASAGSDWRTNPATQIKWGLSYIKARYGTPSAAWSYWQGHGWY